MKIGSVVRLMSIPHLEWTVIYINKNTKKVDLIRFDRNDGRSKLINEKRE